MDESEVVLETCRILVSATARTKRRPGIYRDEDGLIEARWLDPPSGGEHARVIDLVFGPDDSVEAYVFERSTDSIVEWERLPLESTTVVDWVLAALARSPELTEPPAHLQAYLDAADGWHLDRADERRAIWRHSIDTVGNIFARELSIFVPLIGGPDCAALVSLAIDGIAEAEGRSRSEVEDDLANMDSEGAHTLSDAEWDALRNDAALRYLGVTADEFVARTRAGVYDGVEVPGWWDVAILFPELHY